MNFEIIKAIYEYELEEPATEEAIAAEEEKLGALIPEDYKSLLLDQRSKTRLYGHV